MYEVTGYIHLCAYCTSLLIDSFVNAYNYNRGFIRNYMCNNVHNYSLIFLSYTDRNRNYTFVTNVIRLFMLTFCTWLYVCIVINHKHCMCMHMNCPIMGNSYM